MGKKVYEGSSVPDESDESQMSFQSTNSTQSSVEGNSQADEKLPIRRGRIGEFKLYEVAEHELMLLEKGGEAGLWLNFAICAISIFFSLLVALLTLDYDSKPQVFIVFVVVTVVTAIVSIICFAFWWRNREVQANIIAKIRKRLKE